MNFGEKMTALADNIRILTGSSEKMNIDGMNSSINNANDEVGNQSDLINQIITALAGKVAGSELPDVEEETF